jgi:hypothetical protein
MAKMEAMGRVLVDHNWTSLEEWVRAVRDLADLDDQALEELERLRTPEKKPGRRRRAEKEGQVRPRLKR